MGFLPIDAPPDVRQQLVTATPGMYQSYIASPWQVWPAVPLQRVLEPAPPWGGLSVPTGGSWLYQWRPGLAGWGGLGAANEAFSDDQKNALTTLTRGLLSQAQALPAPAPDYLVAPLRGANEGARNTLMSRARWDDSSWKPVSMGGWDTWSDCMQRVQQVSALLLSKSGMRREDGGSAVARGTVDASGNVRQDSVARAAAQGAGEGLQEGLDNLRKGLPVLGAGAGTLALVAGGLWLLSKR